MKSLAAILLLVSSLQLSATEISDFSGLESYINEFRQQMADGNEQWMLDNDPRFIHLAKLMDTTPDVLKKEAYSGGSPSLAFNEGELECVFTAKDLTVVVIKHTINMEGMPDVQEDLAIYIKGNDNRWWLTRNQNFRFSLAYFDEELNSLKSNEPELARMANDPCLNILSF